MTGSERPEPPPGASSVYTYAVMLPSPGHEARAGGLRGVAGRRVRLVDASGLVVAVSDVPAEEFTEDALKRRLEDLDWLERVARAHNAVVEALSAEAVVLPLRLATVHFDDDSLRVHMAEQRCAFAELLARLDGHVEWGVKVYATGGSEAPPAPGPEAPGAGPGRAYLQRRRQQRRSREGAWEAAAGLGERIDRELAGVVADRRHHRPQSGQLSQGPGQNVVNAAYLVPRDRAEEFRARVEELAAGTAGVRVEVTGPWAPYSFAVPPEPAGSPSAGGAGGAAGESGAPYGGGAVEAGPR